MKQTIDVNEGIRPFLDISLVKNIVPFGNGHINDTFKVQLYSKETFLLQCMKRFVFPDIPAVLDNLLTVTNFLSQEGMKTLRLQRTRDGAYYHKTLSGNYWRLFHFELGSVCFEQTDSEQIARKFGESLAVFHQKMTKLPPHYLKKTFPQFNDLSYHLAMLQKAVENDKFQRLHTVAHEVAYSQTLQTNMLSFYEQNLPQRLVHNDAKLSNILFQKNGDALFLIDLDTVMLGYVHYDFGDMVRTVCSGVADDEKKIEQLKFQPRLYEACKIGYTSLADSFLSKEELSSLDHSVSFMTYMMAVRFLTDYLNGDIFYKTKYPTQNYDRLRCQFQLLRESIVYFDSRC